MLAASINWTPLIRRPRGVRDPEDDYLVALMRATQADFLVSLDRDLLDAQLDDVAAIDPAVFVGRLKRSET
jgi:predicted nucleic acid-binding protein